MPIIISVKKKPNLNPNSKVQDASLKSNARGILLDTSPLNRGGSRVWKEGGHLAEKKLKSKKKKKKKVTTIIASYPLPNILYHVCYVK